MSAATEPWQRLTQVKAEVTATCVCGEENEMNFAPDELTGATQVDLDCEGCGSRLLVYADVDVRVQVVKK